MKYAELMNPEKFAYLTDIFKFKNVLITYAI